MKLSKQQRELNTKTEEEQIKDSQTDSRKG